MSGSASNVGVIEACESMNSHGPGKGWLGKIKVGEVGVKNWKGEGSEINTSDKEVKTYE